MEYEYFGFIKFASKEAIQSTDNGIVSTYQFHKGIEVTVMDYSIFFKIHIEGKQDTYLNTRDEVKAFLFGVLRVSE